MLEKAADLQIQELPDTEVSVDESPLMEPVALPERLKDRSFAEQLEFVWNTFEKKPSMD